MDPQEELQQLLDRQEALKQELKAKKKELLEAQRLRKETLKRQIQRAKSRITARERKLRTRRLILMGSYLEHVTQDDPERKARLMKELDGFLERGSGPGTLRSTTPSQSGTSTRRMNMRKKGGPQHDEISEKAVSASPDEEDVDDLDETKEVIPYTYTITSYGADYPVDSLMKRLRHKDIIVPTFDWGF